MRAAGLDQAPPSMLKMLAACAGCGSCSRTCGTGDHFLKPHRGAGDRVHKLNARTAELAAAAGPEGQGPCIATSRHKLSKRVVL